MPESLLRLLQEGVQKNIFPGVASGVASCSPERRIRWQGVFGNRLVDPEEKPMREDTFFDLASLTKPLATTLAILALIDDGVIHFDSLLPEMLGTEVPEEKKKIRLRELLSHSSGLPAYFPFYQRLIKIPEESRKDAMLELILAEPLAAPVGTRAIYSDLGFMLLGWIVEEKSGMPLDRFVAERIYQPLSLEKNIFFRPLSRPWPQGNVAAATERCPWRGRVLEGEVSDDNCHVLGGVAGQAGLFANLQAVMDLTVFLLDCVKGRTSHPAFSNALLAKCFQRNTDIEVESSWAFGFDTPSPQGSSAGKYFHPASIGHLGFSGTSFWIDPVRDLVVVLLTNRIHPSRENNGIKEFRPLFHDAVIETLFS